MLSVGPVPLPVVLALIFLLLAMGVARFWPRPASLSWRPANALLLDMFLLGLVGARVLFVLRNVTAYLASPWSVLRIGDGGFDPLGFFIAAAAWALWRLRKTPAVRAPVLAAALLGSSGWLLASFGLQHLQAQRVQVPAVVLQDLAGAPVRLADTQGQPLVLNLWASWCGPCVREMPVLSAAQRRHPQVRFVFVNQGEDAETVQRFLLQHAPALQGVLLDVSSTTGDALGVQAYPSTLFFDRDGRLRELHLGELTAAGLEYKLRRLR